MSPALATAVLGLVLVLTAATFDAEPLYVPGIAFTGLAVGAIAWVALGSRGLRVQRDGRRAHGRRGASRARSRSRCARGPRCSRRGVIDDPLLPAPAPMAAGRRRTRLRIQATLRPARAEGPAGPAHHRARPASAWRRAIVRTGEDAEVLVLPRVEPVGPAGEGARGDGLGLRRGRPLAAAEVELDGLRPLRPGAPASRIFWPALARAGELVERRLLADTDTRPLVVLDPRAAAAEPRRTSTPRSAPSLAASTWPAAAAARCCCPATGARLALDADARGVAARARAPRARRGRAASDAQGLASAAGPCSTSPRSPRGAAAGAAARVGAGRGRLLVVPGVLPGRAASFAVAGCTAYALRDARARAGVA